jgi:hypothetical protein
MPGAQAVIKTGFAGQAAFHSGLFNVQDLALSGKSPGTSGRGPAWPSRRRVALDQVDFAHRRVFSGGRQLAGQAHAVEHALAPRVMRGRLHGLAMILPTMILASFGRSCR